MICDDDDMISNDNDNINNINSINSINSINNNINNIILIIGGVTGEENDSLFPSMSYQNRLYGFIGCFAFGWILTIFSTVALWTGNITGVSRI